MVSPAGSYAPDTRSNPTLITEDGYYAEIGMTYKMRVLPNKERKTTDGRHQVLCQPGWYLENYVCTATPAGTFAPIGYSSSGHRTAGITCPDGTWSIEGSVECRVCPPGYECATDAVPTT
jgi:hypothetical protein